MASWMKRNRSTKSGGRPEDGYKLDPGKSEQQNAMDIVLMLSQIQTNEHKRLCLLNCLVKLMKPELEPQLLLDHLGFSTRELLYVISACLSHQLTQVRAASLRALRYQIQTPSDLQKFNEMQLPDLLCRSLDILLKNDEERVQALKLIRKMLVIQPKLVSASIVRCLVSLGSENGDRMLRSCLAVLCEFGVLHPQLLICCGGVSAITRNVLECHSPRIAESLCGVLLHLLERPETRMIAGVRLDCLAAPYCDFTYRAGIMDKNKDARDLRFTCSRLALLSVLRSWAGVIEFCDPNKVSGLKAIVDILYLNQLEVRKAILDLLYELLGVPQPVWTDEYSVALSIIDPSEFQDSWRLSEGFVAMEGRSILPTLAKSVPNVCEIHTALLLYCFLETGLMDSLVEVIVTSDTFISVRATVLLGKLIHLMHRLLPADISSTSSALPRLVTYATQNNHQATAAIAALQNLHQIMKNRPASCSLYLDYIIQSGNVLNTKLFRREIHSKASCLPLRVMLNTRSANTICQRIDTSKLTSIEEMQPGVVFSMKTFYKRSRRQRHNSSGSNSVDLPFNEAQPNSSLNASTISAGSSGSGNFKPSSLKRSGSIKLNKFLQFLDPSQSASFMSGMSVSFVIDDKEIVQLNTEKEVIDRLIKDSEVLANKEASSWDWDIIGLVFRTNLMFFLQKMDDNQVKFLRRIIQYFKPSSNRFSHQDLGLGRQNAVNVYSGIEMIDWYLRMYIVLQFLLETHPNNPALSVMTTTHLNMVFNQFYNESVKYLSELIDDINHHLDAILTSRSSHDCLFSPAHMISTMCQQYFLFIGRMCQNDFGIRLLNNNMIFQSLENIIRTTNHVCYVKLIVTGLNYSYDGAVQARRVLEIALTECKIGAGRLYATQFMSVLMRAKVNNFEKWGIPLLVNQLVSSEKAVVLAALEILDEACHDETYLKELIALWPNFNTEQCGDNGKLVVTHFYSSVSGLENRKSNVQEVISMWVNSFNKRYVLLVEADVHASLTLHNKNEDGSYCRRSFSSRPAVVPPNLQPHLFGQLCRTLPGCVALQTHGNVVELLEIIFSSNTHHLESECLHLKAALYAIGHIMSSTTGIDFVKSFESPEIVAKQIINHVKYHEIYSIRATALTVLGLIGSTNYGANILYKFDWISVRHHRNTMWPVNELDDWLAKFLVLANTRHQHDELLTTQPYNYNGLNEFRMHSVQEEFKPSTQHEDTSTKCSVDVDTKQLHGQKNTGSGYQKDFCLSKNTVKHNHVRSLSESKTIDGIHLWSQPLGAEYNVTSNAMNMFGQRQRINSGTDSNTSGVSSCDSTFGKNIIMNDMQQTLSPIPSTSDLLEFRNMFSNRLDERRTGQEERFRKISLTGIPIRDTKFNLQDLQGIAKIRHIKRNQRPMLSESAAEDLIKSIDFDMDGELDSLNKSLSQTQMLRSLKVRSLDRHQSSFMTSSGSVKLRESSELSVQSNESLTSLSSKLVPTVTPPVMDLETSSSEMHNRLDDNADPVKPCYIGICMPRNIFSLFPKRNVSTTYVSVNSPEPDINDNSNKKACLICSRYEKKNQGLELSNHHRRLILLKTLAETIQLQGRRQELSEMETVLVAILSSVQRMANPVLLKQSKISLLELKQKHSEVFQDLCLYSEVMKFIGQNTYRQNARRFVHELFLDINFDETFYSALNDCFKRIPKQAVAVESETIDEVDGGVANRASASPHLFHSVDEEQHDAFARVALACTVNKFPIKRDRSQSLNESSRSTSKYEIQNITRASQK